MTRTLSFLGGAAIGACAMYAFDPQKGRRRRAIVRDELAHLGRHSRSLLDKAILDLEQRSRGAVVETLHRVRPAGPVDDEVLAARVRARLGHCCSHPHAVISTVEKGVVQLRGPVLADELEDIVAQMKAVPGVVSVEHQLEAHVDPTHIPGLQGAPRGRRDGRLPPSLRLLGALGAASLGAFGLRRGPLGIALAGLGAALGLRMLANRDLAHLVGATDEGGIRVIKTLHVDAPVGDVFALWSNFENFPRFMARVKAVRELGDGRSRWTVVGPAGIELQWDAQITQWVADKLLAFRSVAGSPLKVEGFVRFEPEFGGTRLDIQLEYLPPGGVLGHAVAELLGADPKHAMVEDLIRFKSLVENGKTSLRGNELYRDDLTGKKLVH